MALKPRLIRRWQKEIRKLGTINGTEVLNKNEDGTIDPDKRNWGYAVYCTVNGHRISSYDDSWYGAWQGAVYSARTVMTMPEFKSDSQ